MPIYKYKCQECEQVNEIMHLMSESIESLGLKCENCGSNELKRLISAPFIITKGLSSSCPTGTCPLMDE